MGMFNSIYVKCPNCGEKVEFQTKSGSCLLNNWDFESAPKEELKGIIGDSWRCTCGHKVSVSIIDDEEENNRFRKLVKIK